MNIQKVNKQEFSEVNNLLKEANLPLVNINEQTEHFYMVNNELNTIAGVIGLEVYGNYGLLRSLVVRETERNKGIARLLVDKILKVSKELGLKELYLLTTTADEYFEKHQFTKIQRDIVADEIKKSSEFSSICPVSAIVMRKNIQ